MVEESQAKGGEDVDRVGRGMAGDAAAGLIGRMSVRDDRRIPTFLLDTLDANGKSTHGFANGIGGGRVLDGGTAARERGQRWRKFDQHCIWPVYL